MSLQPGDQAAIQWVAAEFAKTGLEPTAPNSCYLQAVPLIEYRGDRDASFVRLKRREKTIQWRAPDVIGGFHDDLEITAPLVFAGYGITAPGMHCDDYNGIDAQGKIVAVFEHEPQESDQHKAVPFHQGVRSPGNSIAPRSSSATALSTAAPRKNGNASSERKASTPPRCRDDLPF